MITPMNLFADVFSGCLQWSNIKGMNLREFVFKEGPDLQIIEFTVILSYMELTVIQRGACSLVFQGYKQLKGERWKNILEVHK